MPLPGANVKLVELRAPGGRKPNGDPGAPGAVLWAGEAPGYLSRADEATTDDGREVMVRVTRLDAFISEGAPEAPVAGADWNADTVLVEDLDGNQTRFTVTGFERKGQGTVADKIRLILDNPVAA